MQNKYDISFTGMEFNHFYVHLINTDLNQKVQYLLKEFCV